jgi:hypothetical protein
MRQIKVSVEEGMDTLSVEQVQDLEAELDLALAMCNYTRYHTSKFAAKLEFAYCKQVNGKQPS